MKRFHANLQRNAIERKVTTAFEEPTPEKRTFVSKQDRLDKQIYLRVTAKEYDNITQIAKIRNANLSACIREILREEFERVLNVEAK